MAFTYEGNLENPVEFVRFLIGDKNPEVALFQDGEILFFINKYENPTEKDLKRVALVLLKQMLNELLRGPSRERSGGYEVYGATAETLKLAVTQLEAELRSLATPLPSFGGVWSPQTENNRKHPAYVPSRFTDDSVFGGR